MYRVNQKTYRVFPETPTNVESQPEPLFTEYQPIEDDYDFGSDSEDEVEITEHQPIEDDFGSDSEDEVEITEHQPEIYTEDENDDDKSSYPELSSDDEADSGDLSDLSDL